MYETINIKPPTKKIAKSYSSRKRIDMYKLIHIALWEFLEKRNFDINVHVEFSDEENKLHESTIKV